MATMTPESSGYHMPVEDREFYIELGASAALAVAIVLFI